MSRKKIYKLNKYKLFRLIIFFIFFILLIFSATHIINWFIDNRNNSKQLNNLQKNIKIEEIDDENAEIIGKDVDKFDPYWDFIKMKLINVDFNELKKQNNDTVGWIQVNGTNINYPFVKGNDNDYYLNHSFDKSSNGGGWLFMDYRNNNNDLDKNTIIYGHGRKNNTLFGTLNKILSNDWIENSNNYVVKLSTEKENTLWQVFSVYKIPTTSDYLQISFNENEFVNFSNKLLSRSIYDFKTSIDKDDKILTLSTCYNNDEKTVLHAKLIKRIAR